MAGRQAAARQFRLHIHIVPFHSCIYLTFEMTRSESEGHRRKRAAIACDYCRRRYQFSTFGIIRKTDMEVMQETPLRWQAAHLLALPANEPARVPL